MTSQTTDRPRPAPATGPVECTPWCVYGDGHPECDFREDQVCYTTQLRVDLSLHPALEESQLVTVADRPEWVAGPDYVQVWGHKRPDEPVEIHICQSDGPEEWRFTRDEAQQLIEALQLALGQVAQ